MKHRVHSVCPASSTSMTESCCSGTDGDPAAAAADDDDDDDDDDEEGHVDGDEADADVEFVIL